MFSKIINFCEAKTIKQIARDVEFPFTVMDVRGINWDEEKYMVEPRLTTVDILAHLGCDDTVDVFHGVLPDGQHAYIFDSREYVLIPQVRNFNPLKALGLLVAIIMFWAVIGNAAFGAEGMILRKAAIEAGQYIGTNHDPYLLLDRDTEKLSHTTNMIMDIDLVCTVYSEACLYFNNSINSKASTRQYRSVEWNYHLGLSLGKYLELGWEHMSRHELDRKSDTGVRYPLENVAYIQFKFVDRPRQRGY